MGRGARGRKRPHEAIADDHSLGVAATLSYLNDQKEMPAASSDSAPSSVEAAADNGTEEWQVAEAKGAKKRKKLPAKDGGHYPAIWHSPQARLQSWVKVSDLQNLVLYLLADGSGPQWCSVKHHANVRKVVALMVPGLEIGMFDGTIPLDEKPRADGTSADSSAIEPQESDSRVQKDALDVASPYPASSTRPLPTPDDFYPTRLEHDKLPEPLQPLADMFEHVWPVRAPGDDKFSKMHSPMAGMLTTPVVKSKEEKRAKGPQPPAESKSWENKRTPITEFIASTSELVDDGYVLHPAHYLNTPMAEAEVARKVANKTTTDDGWADTPGVSDLAAGAAPQHDIEAGSITQGRKVLTMDCEMCLTSPPGTMPQILSLTRISVVDWDGEVVMDELVKPAGKITDYLTPYSGITAEMLKDVTTTLEDIQKRLMDGILTPQTILVGHSLNSDLNALRITHPFIVDTAIIFPHPRGAPLKSSLKWLAQRFLTREIQRGHGATGHDSIEDARACLDLVKQKCERGKAWGTSEASSEPIFRRLARAIRPKRYKSVPSGDDEPRLGAVVDWGDPSRGYGAAARVALACDCDADVVRGIARALGGQDDNGVTGDNGSHASASLPPGGVDFVFARMRELEARAGWWNRSKTADNAALRAEAERTSEGAPLAAAVAAAVARVRDIYDALPPCSALVVFSGSGDPRALADLQTLHQRFRDEYRVKKWDQLSVRWTDVEDQALRAACARARLGLALVTVK